MQTRTSRTDVNVRGRGFAGNGPRERIVGDFSRLEIAAQPDAFRGVGPYSHVDAAAMIKAQRAMQAGLTLGADRQRMFELLFESQSQRFQIARLPEQTAA